MKSSLYYLRMNSLIGKEVAKLMDKRIRIQDDKTVYWRRSVVDGEQSEAFR